jgi:hypothetical protein
MTVSVAVGSEVFVGVGVGWEVAQARETKINNKINDIRVCRDL